jgi:hypothetical protein
MMALILFVLGILAPPFKAKSRLEVKSSPRREPDLPGDLLRAIFGNVTEPSTMHLN